MAALTLLLFILAGCGSSNNDFVLTGNPQPGTGTLTFEFMKAQAATVPNATASLRFEFLNASSGALNSVTLPFNVSVTVAPPVGTASVKITALDANGFPVLSLTGPVTVPAAGQNVLVDMSAFTSTVIAFTGLSVTPATATLSLGQSQQLALVASFSDGSTLTFSAALLGQAAYQSSAPSVASVSATGLVSGLTDGVATIEVSFTDSVNVVQTDSAEFTVGGGTTDVLTIAPLSADLPPGATQAFSATFTPAGGTASDVTATTTFTASSADLTFAGALATVSEEAQVGGTVTVTATFVDGQGDTNTAQASVTVIPLSVVATQFAAPVGDLELPDAAFTYQVALEEVLNNGQTRPVAVTGFQFESSAPAIADIDANGLITTNNSNAAGTTVIRVLDADAVVIDSFTLTVADTNVSAIQVVPEAMDLVVAQGQAYQVLADYSNGTTGVDVTHSPLVTSNNIGPGTALARFQGGEALGLGIGDPTVYEFALQGHTDTVDVRVALGYVTALNPTIGGLTSGLVPEDFSGVVGATATLTDGRVVTLEPTELSVTIAAPTAFVMAGPPGAPLGTVLMPMGGDNQVGDSDVVTVGLAPLSTRFVPADPGFTPSEITATVVSKANATAEFAFRFNPDEPVVFWGVTRQISVSFSNAEVSGFDLAAANLALASPIRLTLLQGFDGFASLLAVVDLNSPSPDILVSDSLGSLTAVATAPTLQHFSGIIPGGYAVPGAAVIAVGEEASFRAELIGYNSMPGMPAGPASTFDITDELQYFAAPSAGQVLYREPGEPVTVFGAVVGITSLLGYDANGSSTLVPPALINITP